MTLNHCGVIVANEWLKSEEIRKEIILDAWVVMPNHFHGIVFIENDRSSKIENTDYPKGLGIHPKVRSLSTLIGGFKAAVTKQINIFRNTPGTPVWQRNYHEAIVRDQKMLHHLRGYIENNPRSWAVDCLYQP
jgi:REP element-mobilizing transposase RayT